MSHFAVLVIGAAIEAALAPFHEFECTGVDDQYVVDVDQTEEMRNDYESHTQSMVRLADGTVHNRYDDRFQQPINPPPKEAWHRQTEFVLPEGAEEFEQKSSEMQTFAEWLRDYQEIPHKQPNAIATAEGEQAMKYHYYETDEAGEVSRVIRRTNPNKKWDWYQVGGRWSGYFQVKGDVAEGLRHVRALQRAGKPIPDSLLELTRDVNMGERSWTNKAEEIKICRVDSAPKGKIDFEQMRADAEKEAAERYDAFYEIVGTGTIWSTWEAVLEATKAAGGTTDDARGAYHDQAPLKALRESKNDRFGFFFQADSMLIDRSTYLQNARDGAIVPYAVLHNGAWLTKGEMGWWGFSNDLISQSDWNRRVNELVDSLPDDTLLSIVDCHI